MKYIGVVLVKGEITTNFTTVADSYLAAFVARVRVKSSYAEQLFVIHAALHFM